MTKVLQIHPKDNIVVALSDLKANEQINCNSIIVELKEAIPAKHKFAAKDFLKGEAVYLYGVLVGKATKDIRSGELIHTHNIKHASEENYYKQLQYEWQPPDVSKWESRTFQGYFRSDGRVGTANYWLFVPTVFCENRNLTHIKEALLQQLGYSILGKYSKVTHRLIDSYRSGSDCSTLTTQELLVEEEKPVGDRLFPNVDGIKFLLHEGGCGGTRQDSITLSRLLAAYADHPNVAGITVLSLGCQHLQTNMLKEHIYERNPQFSKTLYILEQQDLNLEKILITEAIRVTFLGLIEANKIERTPQPLSKLSIGVKCGGSDGFSGISANPAVGKTADLLVALGGQVLLAEFPELFGVEQELVDRCETVELAQKFTRLMKEYNAQALAVGSGFSMNPSPGNIKDGLITDAIKSAGAARKGGTAPITDVLDYTEAAKKPGLNLVCTPGNDVEATTGKAASGATLILFTTGLGTPTGNVVCPTIKLATTTALAKRMNDIIDIDCGQVITGAKTLERMGEEILEYCISVASGQAIPKATQLGQDDFIPWKRGVSL